MSENTIPKAIRELDELQTGDCESAHSEADSIILQALSELGGDEIVEAYYRVMARCSWWACA